MKTIVIPADVILKNTDGSFIVDKDGMPVIISFKTFVNSTLLVDAKFGKSMADILSAVEMKQKLSECTDVWELDNADWERLNAVMSEPSAAYNPVVVMQLHTFLLAIKNAK
jgi:hypothetical protein